MAKLSPELEAQYQKDINSITPGNVDTWGALKNCHCPTCMWQRQKDKQRGKDLFS